MELHLSTQVHTIDHGWHFLDRLKKEKILMGCQICLYRDATRCLRAPCYPCCREYRLQHNVELSIYIMCFQEYKTQHNIWLHTLFCYFSYLFVFPDNILTSWIFSTVWAEGESLNATGPTWELSCVFGGSWWWLWMDEGVHRWCGVECVWH